MRIFISTNGSQPSQLYVSDEEKNSVTQFLEGWGFFADPKQPYPVKQVVENVFLLSDRLETLPDGLIINPSKDHLLYHYATKEGVWGAFPNKHMGRHGMNEGQYYRQVFDILMSQDIAAVYKADLIIAVFPGKDPVIEALCAIRDGKALPVIESSFSFVKPLDVFHALKMKVFDGDRNRYDQNDLDHKEALGALRDVLLNSN